MLDTVAQELSKQGSYLIMPFSQELTDGDILISRKNSLTNMTIPVGLAIFQSHML